MNPLSPLETNVIQNGVTLETESLKLKAMNLCHFMHNSTVLDEILINYEGQLVSIELVLWDWYGTIALPCEHGVLINPHASSAFKVINKHDISQAIISNESNENQLLEGIAGLGMNEIFVEGKNVICASYKYAKKPSIEMYHALIDIMYPNKNVPDRILFIGDRKSDQVFAEAAGCYFSYIWDLLDILHV